MTTATTRPLTERQLRMLNTIRRFVARHGYAPSVRELAARHHTSTSVVAYNLGRLEAAGHIRRVRGIARGIVVIDR